MNLKTIAIASATVACILSFSSFANPGKKHDVLKFNFQDYSKKDVQNPKADIRYKDFDNQRIYYYKIKKGGTVKLHTHDTDQTGYFVKGEGQIIFGEQKTHATLKEGDSFFIRHDIVHELTALTDLEIVAFNPGTTSNENANFTH